MQTTRFRMIIIAMVVCGFAVGMAGLLNYFKYRSTANRIVTDRLVVTGRAIENVVDVALDLGLQFSEIATLPATLERERSTDDLIKGIDVFDNEGKLVYSTDKARISSSIPETWANAVAAARGNDWMVEDEGSSAAGMVLKNSFGVTIAHLALRFSRKSLNDENAEVARELALNTLIVFVLSSALAAFALIAVMRRLARDVAAAEAALDVPDTDGVPVPTLRGPFRQVTQRFIQTTRGASREIAELDARLTRGASS